jgi:uncharacterized protein involved in type VI secretion and phage assembly
MKPYYGKYRGTVANNVDPMMMGRVQVSVPTVLGGGSLSWAMPCVPFAGPGVGWFAVPPVGANVWVEFEGGDPDFPIWAGCFWGLATDVPASPAVAEQKVLKTDCIELVMSDLPGAGGVTLKLDSPAVATPISLVMDSNGVELKLDPSKVTITINGIELSNTPSTVKIEAAGIEASCSPSTLKVAASSIEAANSPASVKVAAASIDLANGAGAIAVSSTGVAVNNGALDVM